MSDETKRHMAELEAEEARNWHALTVERDALRAQMVEATVERDYFIRQTKQERQAKDEARRVARELSDECAIWEGQYFNGARPPSYVLREAYHWLAED